MITQSRFQYWSRFLCWSRFMRWSRILCWSRLQVNDTNCDPDSRRSINNKISQHCTSHLSLLLHVWIRAIAHKIQVTFSSVAKKNTPTDLQIRLNSSIALTWMAHKHGCLGCVHNGMVHCNSWDATTMAVDLDLEVLTLTLAKALDGGHDDLTAYLRWPWLAPWSWATLTTPLDLDFCLSTPWSLARWSPTQQAVVLLWGMSCHSLCQIWWRQDDDDEDLGRTSNVTEL